MNNRVTISTFQLFQLFPDAETARVYFEKRRWNGHVVCPHCDGDTRITVRKGKRLEYYRCRDCDEIQHHVEAGSKVYTDEHGGYRSLGGVYEHHHVKHSAGEYVGANDIHINSAESMWAMLKRGLYGTWHEASRRYLHRYVNEATFRLNEGNVRTHTLERLDAFTDEAFRHRLTYMELIA